MIKPTSVAAFDVGNTTIRAVLREEDRWEALLQVSTRPLAGLAERLERPLQAHETTLCSAARLLACSVHPQAARLLREECERATGLAPQFFGRDLPLAVETAVPNPAAVGDDRLLCACGAAARVGSPCVVVGVGTAVTVDLLDPEGRFAGGSIGAGFRMALKALHEGTAGLPLVEPTRPERALGTDTEQAMLSGVWHQVKAGAEALARQLQQEAGQSCPVVVSGGDAELLLPLDEELEVHEAPNLVFDGMWALLKAEEPGGAEV